ALEPRRQLRVMPVRTTGDAGLLAFRFQPSPPGMGVVSRIGPHHGLITADQFVGRRCIVDIGGRSQDCADQARSLIDAHMSLVTEGRTTLALSLGEPGVWVV